MRRWIRQPYLPCCGQLAVAVIANISLEQSIGLFGNSDPTKTKDLASVLHQLGYKCPNKLQRILKTKLAIAKLNNNTYPNWHWVAIIGNKIYDGNYGTPNGKVNWKPNWKITSYLPIER
jgi:hypothetical protein